MKIRNRNKLEDPALLKPLGEVFVSTQWLAEHLNNPDMRIVDLRFLPIFAKAKEVDEDCIEDYIYGHIPGAIFLDCISGMVDISLDGVNPVAPPERFAEIMGNAGIGSNTLVIIYDDAPLPLASARLCWTLRYYGHDKVRVVAGGFRQWLNEARPLDTEIPHVRSETFRSLIQPGIRATKEEVLRSLGDPGVVIIDCLSFERYRGEIGHYLSVRDGHIPGAVCVPWLATAIGMEKASSDEVRMEAMAGDHPYPYLPIEELRGLFTQIDVWPGKRVITYCVRGYASCTVYLALKMIGFKDVAVYDGSIAEWSRDPTLPMETSIN